MKSHQHLAAVDLARLYLKITDFAKALSELQPIHEKARSSQDWPTYLQVIPLLLRVYAEQMRFQDIQILVKEMMALKESGQIQETAELYYNLGICDAYAGRTESARRNFEACRDLARSAGGPLPMDTLTSAKWLTHAYNGLSLYFCQTNQLEFALAEAERVQEALADVTLSLVLADLKISHELTLALIYREMQRFDQAFTALERAQALLLTESNWYMKINVIYTTGTIYQKMGSIDRAELHLRLARSMVDENQLKHLANQIDLRLLELRKNSPVSFDIVFSREPDFQVHERTKGTIDFGKQLVLFDLLSLFLEQPGRVFSKEELVQQIWNESYNPLIHDNKLYVTLRRLRKLIEVDGCRPRYILRARGGYYFNGKMRVLQESK